MSSKNIDILIKVVQKRQKTPKDKSLRHDMDFRIKHYAGDVTYCVDGFMDKNKDQLYQDFKRLLFNR